MLFDALLTDTAESFVKKLSNADQKAFNIALDILMTDPYPDGITKVQLSFPYKNGTYGFEYGDFWIAYYLKSSYMLGIVAVYWSPKSPKYTIHF